MITLKEINIVCVGDIRYRFVEILLIVSISDSRMRNIYALNSRIIQ